VTTSGHITNNEFTARTTVNVDVHFGAVARVNSTAPVGVLRLSVIGGEEVDTIGAGIAVLDTQRCEERHRGVQCCGEDHNSDITIVQHCPRRVFEEDVETGEGAESHTRVALESDSLVLISWSQFGFIKKIYLAVSATSDQELH
jgi:hypothetical protein